MCTREKEAEYVKKRSSVLLYFLSVGMFMYTRGNIDIQKHGEHTKHKSIVSLNSHHPS